KLHVEPLDHMVLAVIGVQPLDANRMTLCIAIGQRGRLRLLLWPAGGGHSIWFSGRGRGRDHAIRLLPETARAIRLRISTSATSARAAPQARSITAFRGLVMSPKICTGSVFICCERLPVSANALETVNRSGAVSPIPRATASSEPVTSPGSAVGSTTRATTRQRGAPSA